MYDKFTKIAVKYVIINQCQGLNHTESEYQYKSSNFLMSPQGSHYS